MEDLKGKLNFIIPYLEGKEVLYLDYPVHLNVGDLLIYKGTIDFLKNNNITVRDAISLQGCSLRKIRGLVKENTVILLHGGGNFGDIYPKFQEFRRDIVKLFANNKILILPQSVHYNNLKSLDEDKKVFSNNNNLVFFARDKNSLAVFKQFSNSSFLLPDMAHSLFPIDSYIESECEEVLHFQRRDVESVHYPEEGTFDWPDLITKRDRYILFLTKVLLKASKILPIHNQVERFWFYYSCKVIDRSVRFFGNYDVIKTSRLHGHILSMLMSKNCILIDNSYGKNSRYCKAWTEKSPFCKMN